MSFFKKLFDNYKTEFVQNSNNSIDWSRMHSNWGIYQYLLMFLKDNLDNNLKGKRPVELSKDELISLINQLIKAYTELGRSPKSKSERENFNILKSSTNWKNLILEFPNEYLELTIFMLGSEFESVYKDYKLNTDSEKDPTEFNLINI